MKCGDSFRGFLEIGLVDDVVTIKDRACLVPEIFIATFSGTPILAGFYTLNLIAYLHLTAIIIGSS